jgi:hypothetical protein
MFLFSGRGYWQELIESIVWAHAKLAVAPTIYPRALSKPIVTAWSFFQNGGLPSFQPMFGKMLLN